ncbi:hypothetical protein ACTACJ_07050 [Pseudomonas syringae]|uniref:hypothetical protein n=1 Tax=Pseudomonas syringae TaxID=317 RepID=UPI003F82E075
MSTFNGFDIFERWFAVCGDDYYGHFGTSQLAEEWGLASIACDLESGEFNGYRVEKAWVVFCKNRFRMGPFKTKSQAEKAAGGLIKCGDDDPAYDYPNPDEVMKRELDNTAIEKELGKELRKKNKFKL